MTASEIAVTQLNSNDASYTLVEWLAGDGQHVGEGEPVVLLETSKAVEEIVSPQTGYLRHVLSQGSECRPGQVIAEIVSTAGSADQADERPGPEDVGFTMTGPARALAERYGLDTAELAAIGKSVVRAQDVEEIGRVRAQPGTGVPPASTPAADGAICNLSRAQQHVASRVSESHRSIPAAFAAMKVQTSELMATAEVLARRMNIFIGVSELVLKAAAMLHHEHPLLFARSVEGGPVGQLELTSGADLGITVDAGAGLYIPVIKHAETLSLREIAEFFMRARVGAARGRILPADRGHPSMVFAVSHEPDLVLSVPIIFPGTVSTLVLAGTQQELYLDRDNSVATRSVTNVGLAYDHRYVNGRDGIEFLKAMKQLLEAPDTITGTAEP